MKIYLWSTPFKSLAALFIAVALAAPARADLNRTQTISLHKGWNAVYLQVLPAVTVPAVVFSNTPVTVVATFLPTAVPTQFIANPGSIQWNQDGWAVWYAPNRPDAFLASLHAISGNQAYLIYSQSDYTWQVTGAVLFSPLKWKADSFNFTGLAVDDQAPPTFDKFFSGSSAHQPNRIYQLVNDQWALVASPVSTAINSGQAYWIYCTGGSSYQGPLLASIASGSQVTFGASGQCGILLANQGTDPINVRVDSVSTDAGLPLAYMVRGITTGQITPVTVDLPASYQLPVLEAGQSTGFWLALRSERMTSPVQSTLLKISTDNGVQLWLPATGTRTNLPASQ